MENYIGKLIVLEGLDNVGKSTQLKMLAKAIKKRTGEDPLVLREPGSTPIGEKIRKILKDDNNKEMCKETELLLLQAARAQMVREVMAPALSAGRTVICDRYIVSTAIYQGFGRGIPVSFLTSSTAFATAGLAPDLVLLLHKSKDKKGTTIKPKSKQDRFEQEDAAFKKRLEDGLDHFIKEAGPKIKPIVADRNMDVVHAEIMATLEEAGIFGIQLLDTPSVTGPLFGVGTSVANTEGIKRIKFD